MFFDDVDYLVEDVVVIQIVHSMCSSAYHVIKAFHRFRCIIRMFTYALASYRIAGGVTGSSTEGASLDRSAGAPGTGGAQGRRTRRGAARVHRPPT
jgi:hypothetical protein